MNITITVASAACWCLAGITTQARTRARDALPIWAAVVTLAVIGRDTKTGCKIGADISIVNGAMSRKAWMVCTDTMMVRHGA